MRFGRPIVFDEGNRGTHPNRQLPNKAIMRASVAEDPTTAMHVQNSGKETCSTDRLDNADTHVPNSSSDGDPLLVDVELGDGGRLNIVKDFSCTFDTELVQKRRLRRSVRELLRCRLEDVPGH